MDIWRSTPALDERQVGRGERRHKLFRCRGRNKAVINAIAIDVAPHNLAIIVDPPRSGGHGVGNGNGAKHTLFINKAVTSTACGVNSHNLATIIEPKRQSLQSTGNVNRGKYVTILDKAVRPTAVGIRLFQYLLVGIVPR